MSQISGQLLSHHSDERMGEGVAYTLVPLSLPTVHLLISHSLSPTPLHPLPHHFTLSHTTPPSHTPHSPSPTPHSPSPTPLHPLTHHIHPLTHHNHPLTHHNHPLTHHIHPPSFHVHPLTLLPSHTYHPPLHLHPTTNPTHCSVTQSKRRRGTARTHCEIILFLTAHVSVHKAPASVIALHSWKV